MIKLIPDFVRNMIQKANPSMFAGMFRDQNLPKGSFTPAEYRSMAEQGYGKNASVYTAINLICKNLAEIQWKVVDLSKGKDKKKDVTVWENNHLILNPNDRSSAYNFKESLAGYFMLSGNGYILPVTNSSGRKPVYFYVIRPDMVRPIMSRNDTYLEKYRIGDEINYIDVDPDLLMHSKTFNPLNSYFGMSPLSSILQDVDLINSGKTWNVSLQQNMGKPSGIVSAKEILGESQFNRLEKQVRDKFQGIRNSGNVWIGDGDLSWKQTSINPSDVDWLEGIRYSKLEIVTALGVPPELVGIAEQKTYNNVKQARQAFYKETVIPLAKFFLDDINIWLKLNGWINPDWFLEIDYSSISGLEEDENETFKRLSIASWLTDNEKRIRSGYQPVEGDEDYEMTDFQKQKVIEEIRVSAAKQKNKLTAQIEANKPKEIPAPQKEGENEVNGKPKEEDKKPKKKMIKDTHTSIINASNQYGLNLIMKTIESDRQNAENQYKIAISALLFNQYESLKKHLSNVKENHILVESATNFLDKTYLDTQLVIGSGHKTISYQFAEETIKGINSSSDDIVFDIDRIKKDIDNYVDSISGDISRQIIKTTKEKVNGIINDGVANDLSVTLILSELDKSFTEKHLNYRADLISKTEVVRASNAGIYFVGSNSSHELKKVWVTVIDQFTRDGKSGFDHVHANDQKVGINEPFTVSNERLLFAGDISLGASAGNVINCRCSLHYEI